jgi:Rha family phage regulatory protein
MDLQKIIKAELVKTSGQQVRTDSLIVADRFKKRHGNVIRKIENLMKMKSADRLNFELVEYADQKGEMRKFYTMDRKSFAILAMSFTEDLALRWKLDFLSAFESMERALLRQHNLEWQSYRLEGKEHRLELTDSIQKLVQLAERQGSRYASRYYVSFTQMVYQQVFGLKKVPGNFRDLLDEASLKRLRFIEEHAAIWLNEAVQEAIDYHAPFKVLKSKLKNLIDVIGGIDLHFGTC